MSSATYVYDEVERLKEDYKTNDPLEIIQGEGIIIRQNPLFTDLKGFYTVADGFRYIGVNPNLELIEQKIVLAHELGHDILHRKETTDFTIHDTMLFGNHSIMEREANEFAANLLISDSVILDWFDGVLFEDEQELINDYPKYFIAFKINDMRRRGYTIPEFNC